MPDPTDNDPWADLYADLGVTEKPQRPAAAPAQDRHAPADEPAPADDADGDDGEEGDDFEGEGSPASEGGEGGEEGAPKKRRRRRRRGKKKPGDETPAGATAAGFGDDAGDGDEMPEYGRNAAPPARAPQAAEPPRRAAPAARPPVDIADDDSGFGAGGEGEPADGGDSGGEPVETRGGDASLEGATTEMTRELLANWNVPSWEELVRGLHRPSH